MEISEAGTKKQSPNGLLIAQAYRPLGIATNQSSGSILTFTYNPFTTPRWEQNIQTLIISNRWLDYITVKEYR